MNLRDLCISDLTLPRHVYWEINDHPYAEIENYENTRFTFNYTLDHNLSHTDLKTSIRNALIRIHTLSGKTLAICVGGADSEIIARESAYLGLPAEIFFLSMWGINKSSLDKIADLSTELRYKLNVINLSREEAFESIIPTNFSKLQAEKPTYLCLPFLFNQIPPEMFIVGGEGDPQKSGRDYEWLAADNGLYNGLPISITELWYRQWAITNNRDCEMYFYSSTQELIKSYFYHPLLEKKNKCINTRGLVDALWPNLKFNYKTTNWEDEVKENYNIRMYVRMISNGKYKYQPNACLTKI